MNNRVEEIEIDLIDLCKELLKKWKTILIVCIIGCLLGGVFGFLKKDSIANYDDLKEQDFINMEAAYNYRQQYNSQVDYNNHSYIMSINSNNVAVGTMRFYTNADAQELKTKIDSCLYDEETKNKISTIIGDYNFRSNEIISVNYLENSNFNSSNGVSVTITVKSANEGATNQIIDLIINCLNDEKILNTTPTVSVETIYDTSIDNTQKNAVSNLISIYDKVTTYENKLSDDIKNYYTINYLHEELEESSPLKYVVIGGMLCGVIVCGYYACLYVFAKTVKTRSEIKNYGLKEIASVSLDSKDDKTICSFDYLDSMINKLVSKKAILSYENVNEEIINKLKKNNKLVLSKEIYLDDSSFNVASDGLIVVVEIKKTSKEFVLKTLETCELLGIKVIGAIVVL